MDSPLPSLFISHGSPMLALEDAPTSQFLRGLAAQLPQRPRAIVVASAHWETRAPELTSAAHPEIIHDFYGFPEALYQLRYPSPGDPSLAAWAQSLLSAAGIEAALHPTWPLDHGVWNPLLLMYPKADIPVVELSIQSTRDARYHYALGQALAPLREEGVLVIGSGNLTHNLREAFRGHYPHPPAWVTDFADWVAARVAAGDVESLLAWEKLAPHAKQNHPTPEHFLPFFVALGAGSTPLQATRLHADTELGVLAMDAYAFGEV